MYAEKIVTIYDLYCMVLHEIYNTDEKLWGKMMIR